MYSKSAIASAVLTALLVQPVIAAEQEQQDNVEVIQVKGIKGSLNKALNNKRFNTQIVDSIVAEDIGKFPDNNVVEALQRVTGVQVTGRGGGEVSTVSIRGLNDVHTTINGRDVFTGTGRAVALQDIPASLLSGVTVFKTRSASQTERGIAGSIDIKTNRPFNFEGSKVVLAARGIYADQPQKIDPNLSALASNRWETDFGEMGALVNISYVETNYRDDGIVAGARFPFFTDNAPFPHEPYAIMTDTLSTDYWDRALTNGLPSAAGSMLSVDGQQIPYYLAPDAVFGTVGEANRKRPAASASFQWAVNDELELLAEGFYTGYRQEFQNSLWFSNVFEGDGNSGNLNIQPPLLIEGTNLIKERQVYAPGGFQSGDATTGKTDSYLYALGAKWMPNLDLTINSELIFQDSTFESEFFAMRFDRNQAYGLDVDFNNSEGVPSLEFWDNPATAHDESDMTELQNWNTGTAYDQGGKQKGDSVTLKIDGEYFVDSIIEKVRFGLKAEKRNALNYQREQDKTNAMSLPAMIQALTDQGATNPENFVKITDDYMFGRAEIFDSFAVANGVYMLDNEAAIRTIYDYEKDALTNTFNISEDSYAAYVTTDYRYGDVSGEFGLRYVSYEQDMEFEDFEGEQGFGQSKQTEVLPSATLNWDITDDLVGRIAYTKTLRMPAYDALSPLQFWFEPLTDAVKYGTGNGGNPDLQPTKSTNYDLSLEWYFAPGSSLYGALFQRDIEGLVISGKKIVPRYSTTREEIINYTLSAPVNASEGELSGMEIGLVYVPEDLPEALDGIGVQASYTQLDSSQTVQDFNDEGEVTAVVESNMAGVSDSSYSLVTFYEKENYDMRLSYVWREAFYTGDEGPDFANPIQFWSKPEQSLDFQFSYDVSEDLTVTFDATNILDDKYQSHYGKGNLDTFNFGSNIYSKTYAVGVRYSF